MNSHDCFVMLCYIVYIISVCSKNQELDKKWWVEVLGFGMATADKKRVMTLSNCNFLDKFVKHG